MDDMVASYHLLESRHFALKCHIPNEKSTELFKNLQLRLMTSKVVYGFSVPYVLLKKIVLFFSLHHWVLGGFNRSLL